MEPEVYAAVQNNPWWGLGVTRWGRLRLGPDDEVTKYTSKLARGTFQGAWMALCLSPPGPFCSDPRSGPTAMPMTEGSLDVGKLIAQTGGPRRGCTRRPSGG